MADAAQSSQAPHWEIVISGGDTTQKTYVFTQNITTIGREADNDIVLADEQISGHQGRFIRQAQHLLFEVLESGSNTLLNGEPLTHPAALGSGDTLTLGSYNLTVQHSESVLPAETPDAPGVASRPPLWPFLLIIALALEVFVVQFLE